MHDYFAGGFLASAHRGGDDAGGPENSMVAFARAVDMGYRCIETDVHATRDGVVVAFHDARLERVTDGHGLIRAMEWDQVRRVRIAGREPIPTLDEVLASFPDTVFNLDIKHPTAIGPLVRVLTDHRAAPRVAVASFQPSSIARFRRLMPDVATGVASPWVAACALAPTLLSRVAVPGDSFQIPLSARIAGRDVTVLSPELLDAAHRAGKAVQVWTINDPTEMARLIDLGVDGIVSDRIVALREVCQSRGRWTQGTAE